MDLDIDPTAASFEAQLEVASTLDDIDRLEREFVGKRGSLRMLKGRLAAMEPDQRRHWGQRIEQALSAAEDSLRARRESLASGASAELMAAEWTDVTLASGSLPPGASHPITVLERRCIDLLRAMGFERADGPEVETPYYNFDSLNVPLDHPARDLQDTFWVTDDLLLRSHTTSIQARVLQAGPELPLKVVAAGRVYRNEAVDATHLAMFHQLEGFWVDRSVTLENLKHVLGVLVRGMFGEERRYRFKPKFYPYTEPSIGIDISCAICQGSGCSACHDVGWVTVIGAGMIHPKVLRGFGYDPDEVSGFAFGWGTTRLAYQWLHLDKVKDLYTTNVEDLAYYHSVAATSREI